jgi:hypothetical protein
MPQKKKEGRPIQAPFEVLCKPVDQNGLLKMPSDGSPCSCPFS